MPKLSDPVTSLNGVGEKRTNALKKLDIVTIHDLLYHIPRSYLDYSNPVSIDKAELGQTRVIRVRILQKMSPQYVRRNMTIYKAVATDGESNIIITIYNNSYGFQQLHTGSWYRMSGKISGNLLRREILSPHMISDIDSHLIYPNYPLTEGITIFVLTNLIQQAIDIFEKTPYDPLPESIRWRRSLIPLCDAIKQVHFPDSAKQLEAARRRLAFDELLNLHLGMLLHRRENNIASAYSMEENIDMTPFFAILPFTMTHGQREAIDQIVHDMCQSTPMNRLLQGDVGSGKTAVAAAVCYFAIQNGVMCALMAPTEILATQHASTLSAMLMPLKIRVALLTGSTRVAEKRTILQQLVAGEIDLLIGTHAIFQKDVTFSNLGLVITDEQHRFGVDQRARFADKGGQPHKLVISATPIPRTLALMIYGDLDISVLRELPHGRKPIQTFAVTGKLRMRAYNFILEQLAQHHQGYIVCPTIDNNPQTELKAVIEYAERIAREPFSNYRVACLHGRMKSAEKEDIMTRFAQGEIDLLVSTTVIEVGIDVPNATILLIEDAERFGLSQLHQLRGRVGRGDAQSYCILVSDHVTEDCRKRMQIMSRTSDGFEIAEADLKLRGPGDFLGQRQHGLPPLKIADLSGDTQLIAQVQETTKEILSEDPTLSKPQYRQLRDDVIHLYGQVTENERN